ncbi:MAG: aminomethyl-transferring glycine dehydrogenase subunit GcvPB [Planctomycetota bacterium]|jgi:glycine dehydrogenase subunit 2
MDFPTLFDKSRPGRRTSRPVPEAVGREAPASIPPAFLRKEAAALPELSEIDVVRHFTALSRRNVGVDSTFYPLGSCTMKYNPKVNEAAAALPGFLNVHPYQPASTVQGFLRLLLDLEGFLCEIGGFDATTLQPAAGAHGELTGLLLIEAYHASRGEGGRRIVLIPDSAHGTNPASCTLAGFKTRVVKSNAKGMVDCADLKAKAGPDTSAMMLTNPNTLGLFEEEVCEMASIVHEAGGLMYMDGANLNAILGVARPGDFGIDVMHYNLHKTFSTPHGGGGPGSGPVGVKKALESFLPVPRVTKEEAGLDLTYDRPASIGPVRSFLGNVGVAVKAYAYIRHLGAAGLREVAEIAVLNANYVMTRLKGTYALAFDRRCMHECVFSARPLWKAHEVRALDVAKGLIDRGFHPPTIYFPLVVPEALMIEPTETESRETLEAFIEALEDIAEQARTDPGALHAAPTTTPVGRLDEVKAVKDPCLKYCPR